MRIKKKVSIKVLALHVLIEYKSENVVRAHCLEFDLSVSGKNDEQAMVRMEGVIENHIQYACATKSNPVHMAASDIQKKWFDPSPSKAKKSWVLELHFGNKMHGKQRAPKSHIVKKYEQNFSQLACV